MRSASREFAQALRDVHAGRLPFDAFARQTDRAWRSLAVYLMRRWASPAAVSEEDVVQELLLAAWRRLPSWDASKAKLDEFIVWNACNDAKRFLHRQRGANLHGSPDRNPSRFPIALSSLRKARHDDERREAARWDQADTQPSPEETAAARQAVHELASALPERDRPVLAALAVSGWAVESATELLYTDRDARLVCRFGSRRDARRAATRVAALTERLTG